MTRGTGTGTATGAGPWTAHVDGGAHPNPGGVMGIGVVVRDPRGATVREVGERLPEKGTNNEAEYRAVLRAIEEAVALGADRLVVHADSKLTVNTLSGRWRVRAPHLVPWKQRIDQAAAALEHVAYRWVPREQNKEADRLATEAMGGTVSGGAKFRAREAGPRQASAGGSRAGADAADCPRCGATTKLRWQTFRNRTRHIRMECPTHGFIGYVPKSTENVAAADATDGSDPANAR